MSSFLNPYSISVSPEIMNEREKQKRIHNWLGDQSSGYLNQASQNKGSLFPSYHHVSHLKNESINGNQGSCDDYLLKSRSQFVSDESVCKKSLKNGLDSVTSSSFVSSNSKEKLKTKTFQTNLFPFVGRLHNAAAIKIQALWRGYYARLKNPKVVGVRQEIRARRAEQYIATLCNELSVLKQKQKADKKLRELQTEAIRFMWSQIRKLQNSFDTKVSELESKIAEAKLSDDNLSQSELFKENSTTQEKKDKEQLKSTVEKLQAQVIQLQDALLSFSDRLVSENEEVSAHSIHEDSEEEHAALVDEKDALSVISENDDVGEVLPKPINLPVVEDDEVLSARDNVPKITLHNILEALDSCLTEKELWSICEQALICLKSQKNLKLSYLSPSTLYLRKDGLVSFAESNKSLDTTYCAPELFNEGQKPSIKSLIFSLAVTMWSGADFKMTEDQAPCLSSDFENLLLKMSLDELLERIEVNDALKICSDYHSDNNLNSLQMCASLYAETCDMKKGKKRQIKSVSFAELFGKEIEKTRGDFRSNVVPLITTPTFKLKPVSERQLSPKPKQETSLYENFIKQVKTGSPLKKQSPPKLYTVQDMYKDNPELIQKLNILPGQRRKNLLAVKSAMKKLSADEGKQMFPSPPQALKAEIKSHTSSLGSLPNNSRSLVLRWHPSHIYDKDGYKTKGDEIIGYRIYVNRQPKGMVNGNKCRALLDGLKRSGEYRIYLCAVSALGESDPSNTVVANLETEFISTFPTSPKLASCHLVTEKSDKFKSSPKHNTKYSIMENQSADVVERVLQRYGIKKPSLKEQTSDSLKHQSLGFLPSISSLSCAKQLSSADDEKPLVAADCIKSEYPPSSSSGDDHITPRTKALLDQLKDELLS